MAKPTAKFAKCPTCGATLSARTVANLTNPTEPETCPARKTGGK